MAEEEAIVVALRISDPRLRAIPIGALPMPCARCGCQCCVSASSQEILRTAPNPSVICVQCVRPDEMQQPVSLTPGQRDEIKRHLRSRHN